MAASIWSSGMLTKPNPLERPASLIGMVAPAAPHSAKAFCSSSSEMLNGRLPTNNRFISVLSVLSGRVAVLGCPPGHPDLSSHARAHGLPTPAVWGQSVRRPQSTKSPPLHPRGGPQALARPREADSPNRDVIGTN